MTETSDNLDRLKRANEGDESILVEMIESQRLRLHRVIELRLDQRVRRRVDVSDVFQESMIEATARLGEFLRNPKMPFSLWLRFITTQKIVQVHRKHLGAQARDVSREVTIDSPATVSPNSAVLAARLMGRVSTPSAKVLKSELRQQLRLLLEELDPLDREIIALKHFEQLSLRECAIVMEIKHTTACNRYVRALARLKELLMRDGVGELMS